MLDRRGTLALILSGIAAGLAACAGGGAGTSSDTVLEVARAQGLDRFLDAVEAAGLAGTLEGPGPFTVFVPTDRAFTRRLPSDRAALRALVAYHVVPGTFTTAFLAGTDVNYTTAAGTSLNVDGTGGALRVNDASVVRADLAASNGVVHVIDRVLTPR